MKAVVWHGKDNVSVDTVSEPEVVNPHDAVIKVTSTAICGSDLHLYHGYVPTMKEGDILGHEFMGTVVDLGPEVENLRIGDRVVVPFSISCGRCAYCLRGEYSLCDNTNPNAWMAEKVYGHSTAGIFGYSHLFGGYAGGQAEYVRVPFADIGPLKVPENLDDEKVLFLSDVFPTGYMAAENCGIKPGDIIAVWGAGPVGQFAIRSALLLGAHQVIAIDREPARLTMARAGQERGQVVTINFEQEDVLDALSDLTGGRGPDACIDAVGMEAEGQGFLGAYDKVKFQWKLQTDRPGALRQAIQACRKGGTVSIAGVYGGFIDKTPMGAAFNKGLQFRMGQTHVQRYMRPLLERIDKGEIDPSFVISHRMSLDDAPLGYAMFEEKEKECTKVVLRPALA